MQDLSRSECEKKYSEIFSGRSCQDLTSNEASQLKDNSFVNSEVVLQENTLAEIMQKVRAQHYNISENKEWLVYEKCKLLFEKDYTCEEVNNCNYTMNYPVRIIVPVKKKIEIGGPVMDFDAALYSKLVKEGLEYRRRKRFVTPAILFDNKFICRSATLAVKLSTLHNIAAEMVPPQTVVHDEDFLDILINCNITPTLLKKDVDIVEYLKLERIIDLTTGFKKLQDAVTQCFLTREKIHENLYKKIKIEEMPYIGCNYFSDYHKVRRNVKDMVFDWKLVDAGQRLNLTEDARLFFPEMDVSADHKSWDAKELTENYLKLMLSQLVTDVGGMLVHCISGWDRTPLFISLLRLSLWADGVVHESLQFQDITYLTLAYDWFLFGHQFPLRFKYNDEIMHFCFNFLEFITSDEFSVTKLFHELPSEKKKNRVFPEFVPGQRISLKKVRTLFLEIYDKEILKKKEL